MTKLLTAVMAILMLNAGLFSAAVSAQEIRFLKQSYDFGPVANGLFQPAVFQFVNTGTAKTAIITGYSGINVEQITDLRTKLRKSKVEYRVVKNTLAKKAIEGTGLEPLKDYFTGPVGIALGYDDVVMPAKVLFEFSKIQSKLELKTGVLDGKLLKHADLKALATMPSLNALRGKIVGLLHAPASRMVGVLAAPAGQLARVMKAKADKG